MAIPSWLTLSQLSGSGDTVITITATSFTDLNQIREGLLTVTGINKHVNVPVYQSGHTFTLSQTSFSVPASSGHTSFTINTDGTWNISPSSSNGISFSPSSGTGTTNVRIDYADNTSTSPRTATTTASGWTTSAITVTQAGDTLISLRYTTTNGQVITPPTLWHTSEYSSTGATLYNDLGYMNLDLRGYTTLRTLEGTKRVNPRLTNCTSLELINLPNSFPTNSYSFSGCTSLTSATLGIYTIMVGSFDGCSNLLRFVSTYSSSENPIYVEGWAFNGCSLLSYLEFHCPRTAKIYQGAHPFITIAENGTLVRPNGYDYSAIFNELPPGWTVVDAT